jgi:hypothetical protein
MQTLALPLPAAEAAWILQRPSLGKGPYLFTDESRGTYCRTQIILIPGAGRPYPGARAAFHLGQGCLPPGSAAFSRLWRPSSEARTAFHLGQSGLHPGPGQPPTWARTAFHLGQGGLHPGPERPSSGARAAFRRLWRPPSGSGAALLVCTSWHQNIASTSVTANWSTFLSPSAELFPIRQNMLDIL